MSKRDFELLARTLRRSRPLYDSAEAGAAEYAMTQQWRKDVMAIGTVLEKEFLRFRREMFLLACDY